MLKAQKTKTLIVVSSQDFQEKEFNPVVEALEASQIDYEVASSKVGTAIGEAGQKVEVYNNIHKVGYDQYVAIIFIGGPGALEFEDNKLVHEIVRSLNHNHKIVAAICIAPVILAKAGVLEGRQATVFSSKDNNHGLEVFKDYGVVYLDKTDVVTDDNIVTANGPYAAERFIRAVIDKLKEYK